MYPNLIQAPSDQPLFINRIENPKLASQLRQLGVAEDTEVVKQNRQVALKPALIKMQAGSLVLGESMTAEMIIERSDSRLASLALLHKAESGVLKGCIDGSILERVLGDLALHIGDVIFFGRTLPAVEYILSHNHKKTVRLSLERAARIIGTVNAQKCQFAAVRLRQRFNVEVIHGIASADYWLKPGDTLVLKALEKIEVQATISGNLVILRVEDKLKLLLPDQSATRIFVRACDICWSCGECQVQFLQ